MARRVRAAGFSESAEQGARECVVASAVLGMPLHANEETRRRRAHGFDLAIGRSGLDNEIWRQSVDTLVMQRIDRNGFRTGKRRKEAAGRETHIVRIVGIAFVERQVGLGTMV